MRNGVFAGWLNQKRAAAAGVILLLGLTAVLAVGNTMRETQPDGISCLETALNTGELNWEMRSYLESRAGSQGEEGYFVKGVLAWLDGNVDGTVELLSQIGEAETENAEMIRIYTPILLNEAAAELGDTEGLVENSRRALEAIGASKKYRNNIKLCWRAVEPVVQSEGKIQEAAKLLIWYLENVRGLNDETRIALKGNIGQIFSLTENYMDAMFYYMDALHNIEKARGVEHQNYYKMKLLACVGDVYYGLQEYNRALEFYEQVIGEEGKDSKERTVQAMAVINGTDAYVMQEEYDHAEEMLEHLEAMIPGLDPDMADDMEILRASERAQIAMGRGQLDEALRQLELAGQWLKEDKKEVAYYKSIYVRYTYALYCQYSGQEEEALKQFAEVAEESSVFGLSLEETVYYHMAQIYKDRGDLENFSQYRERYSGQIQKKAALLRSGYVARAEQLYRYGLLQQKQQKNELALIASAFGIAGLLAMIVWAFRHIGIWRKRSWTDPLTGLYNRHYLEYYLKKNGKKLQGQQISLVMIDVDHFKSYNDNYGHIEGDRALKEVAAVLKYNIRAANMAVRFGGEEMLLFIPGIRLEQTVQIMERIRRDLKERSIEHKYSLVSTVLTISAGIFSTVYRGQDIADLSRQADQVLYSAKEAGRDRYEAREDPKEPAGL